jgi:uncharacterized protein YeaO (DUF488 family)
MIVVSQRSGASAPQPGGPVTVRLKRAYDERAPDDGIRVLVDRVWPRGVRRDALDIAAWVPEVAPSDELRRWFGHRVERWPEFRERYRRELAEPERRAALDALRERAAAATLTLVFGARDVEHNQAVVIADEIDPHRSSAPPRTIARS